ncbi:RagB/SusD family nutrient uptake outer membrane protein [Pedobacter sp. CFBP9032]|uniref:RagB/SusD family nutrient uptake outer membrane protein n=1 Tax=Pedobacter sp. CFBP9032 TaxID=3096539 RepID=UPI002A6A1816|nr:RagB/SusD family nutrient uptake outer membrane protein [Pedobacter sp. CFBP9032]MDY0905148.1 RagB/SusD family nutrient uptake outer membrane protein [Pedobacter sp. CFBP9032]
MKLRYYILTSAIVLSMFGCKKELDLLPQQSLSDQIVFNSPATTLSALRGVYSTAQTLDFYGSLPQVIGDYMGNNVDFVGTFPTLQDLNNFSAVSTNSNVQVLWQIHYQVIARANTIISKVNGVEGLSAEEKSQYIAEAKFLRALAYFQLANFFSQPFQVSAGTNLSVPLVTADFTGTIEFPSRNTLSQVHAQIIQDLTEASGVLPQSYADAAETRGRATKGAAFALLSRLYLYREEWSKAESAARSTLSQGIYDTAPNYSFYSGNTSEDVFTIQNSAIDNGRTGSGGWASYYNPAAVGGRGDAPFSQDLINAYTSEPGDRRYNLKNSGTAADGLPHFFTSKFPDAVNNSDNSPVIRTTEVYLNLAEALAHQSATPNAEAITILNSRIRSRAGLTAKTVVSQQALIDALLIERRKELAFEGHSRMDLLRNRQPLRVGNAPAAFGGAKTVLPIPQREIDNNPGLQGQQNAGY